MEVWLAKAGADIEECKLVRLHLIVSQLERQALDVIAILLTRCLDKGANVLANGQVVCEGTLQDKLMRYRLEA